jgi:hypothetical protein
MNKYTKDYIFAAAKEAVAVEYYYYCDNTHRLHGDFITEIDLNEIQFDENDSVECHIELMDEETYNHTILANSGISFADIYDRDAKILVVVVGMESIKKFV